MTETKIFLPACRPAGLPACLRLTPNQPAVCALHSVEDYGLLGLTDAEFESIRAASNDQTTQGE